MAAGTTFVGMLLPANEEFMMGKKKLDSSCMRMLPNMSIA